MIYNRVLPRDLFNEAKLLKCLGQLALLIHEGKIQGIEVDYDDEPFVVYQRQTDAGLYCDNVVFVWRRDDMELYTQYNSKLSYPLFLMRRDYTEINVFNEDGTPTEEFLEHIA